MRVKHFSQEEQQLEVGSVSAAKISFSSTAARLSQTSYYIPSNLKKEAMHYLNRASRTPPDVRTKPLNGIDQSLRVNIVTSPRALAFQHQSKSSLRWDRSLRTLKDALGSIFSPAKNSKRRSPPVAITAVLFLLLLWIFWSFILPIMVFGFVPFPTGYPWGNLRYLIYQHFIF